MRQRGGQPACESAKERAHGRRRLSGLGGRRWLWVASAVLFSVLLCSLLGWIDQGAAQSPVPGGLVCFGDCGPRLDGRSLGQVTPLYGQSKIEQ